MRTTPVSPSMSASRRVRSGFTLLELMLVLSIIALIGAIAVPRLEEVFERQQLRGSANELRLVWDTARLNAMRTGQAQMFECQPGTRNYTVKPLLLQSDVTSAGAGATVLLSGGNVAETTKNGVLTEAAPVATDAEQLEEHISFVSCMVLADMRSYNAARDAQTTGLGEVDTQSVSQVVLFYPDGSTSTAEARIQNERGDVRAVQIRGLTGHSRVLDITNVPTAVDEKAR